MEKIAYEMPKLEELDLSQYYLVHGQEGIRISGETPAEEPTEEEE